MVEVMARAVQSAVEAMPYGNGFETEVEGGESFEYRPTTLREFFDETWQSDHGDELFANAAKVATQAALEAVRSAGYAIVKVTKRDAKPVIFDDAAHEGEG